MAQTQRQMSKGQLLRSATALKKNFQQCTQQAGMLINGIRHLQTGGGRGGTGVQQTRTRTLKRTRGPGRKTRIAATGS